ncbi:MAG: hypothetical protein ACM3H7_05010 [Acidobacteriaceae bacterium]
MNISPGEAEESLAAIQHISQKTRQSITNSSAYVFLIITGSVWLIGFLATQFLAGPVVAYIWIGVSLLGSALSIPLGNRQARRLRSPGLNPTARRAVTFWLLLMLYAAAAIAIAHPTDGRQVTMFIVLFLMLGQLSMGMLLSFSATWWALPITALALLGYYLLPGFFYLWMGLLVGGGMIVLGLYIHYRW